MYGAPLGYFITFRTYGTWLHGDVRGSVDRVRNKYGTPVLASDGEREAVEAQEMRGPVIGLSDRMRGVVDRTIREVCEHKKWSLHALNVRTNHAHAVVSASCKPEMVLNVMKAWATRRLIEVGLVEQGVRVWSRHGSTQYLFTAEKMVEKCDYVLNGQ